LQVLTNLKAIFSPSVQSEKKEWLRRSEIRNILRISPGFLQNMGINGKIIPAKIGGIFFYRKDDLDKLLASKVEKLLSA